MRFSRITRLTVRWLDNTDETKCRAAAGELVEYLQAAGNTREQIEYWLRHAGETTTGPRETIAGVIETEATLAKMQGLVKTA